MLFEKNTFLNICYQDRHHDSVQDENELNERLEELRNAFSRTSSKKSLNKILDILMKKREKSSHENLQNDLQPEHDRLYQL